VAFLVLSYPLGVVWFCVLFTLIALSIGTAIIWVGVLTLALAMWLWIRGAWVERWRIAVFLGTVVPSPYRPLSAASLLKRAWARARDIAVWRDLLYLLLLFPLGIFELLIVACAVVAPLSLLALPSYWWALPSRGPAGLHNLFALLNQIDSLSTAVLAGGVGLVWLLLGQYLVLAVARLHAALALALLGPTRHSRLEARVAALSDSRARVMDATVVERQRIERDLHDGVQQRLVALAMHLGMAKYKCASDPGAVQALVWEAHEEAKETLAEVRGLVRGIYPAILADRGLDPAISALAGRCPAPVAVSVDLDGRLPEIVELTAYFLIAEALTNVAKHSRASQAWVVVRREHDRLLIEVGDNGVGGADPSVGTGLAGLADRVAALEGRFVVESPPQGPTRLVGELPCGSS